MSLKFAVVGSLLSALGTRARAKNQVQNLEPVGPHDDTLLTIFGRRIGPAEPEKSEADQALDGRQELRD